MLLYTVENQSKGPNGVELEGDAPDADLGIRPCRYFYWLHLEYPV
jgi:hypothetical protein